MTLFAHDLRYALRKVRRAPGFAIVMILTLALGIGGTTVVFSFLNAVLLRPLPVADQERLVWISGARESSDHGVAFSYPEYTELRGSGAPLSGIAAYSLQRLRVETGDRTFATVGALVSDNYFGTLGIHPAAGRFWTPADAAAGTPLVVLSHHLWQRVYAADAAVVGREIRVNGRVCVVAGVAPKGFGGTINLVGLDLWMPLTVYDQLYPGKELAAPGNGVLELIARMPAGISRPMMREVLTARARQARVGSARGGTISRMVVEPLSGLNGTGRRDSNPVGALLLATAVLVLSIASVNVAGMLTARNALRSGEIAVRGALGASPNRIASQLLTETLLIWTAGGVVGLWLALWLGRVFLAVVPVQQAFPVRVGLHMGLDGRVLAFAICLTLASGLTFGLMPAVNATRRDLVSALKEQSDPGARRSWRRSALISAQVGCSFLLLVNAGLLVKSLREISTGDPGFDPDRIAVVPLDLSVPGDDPRREQARVRAFFPELLRSLGERRDVESVAVSTALPLGGGNTTTQVALPTSGSSTMGPLYIDVGFAAVSTDYFRALRIPLIRGRAFTADDRFGSPFVAIVNAAMARQFWPGADPVGKTIQRGSATLRVIGIAGNTANQGFGRPPGPALYVPFAQEPSAEANLLVRASPSVARSLALGIRALDPSVEMEAPVPLRDLIIAQMPHRLLAPVLGAFGMLGLLLSMIGIYGLVAYFTINRTREFGIRVALGADPGDILRMVIGGGVKLTAAGIALGLPIAVGIASLMTPLLVGIDFLDFGTYAAVILLLLTATVCACVIPARRAFKLKPMSALRAD
jgi:predicted permease